MIKPQIMKLDPPKGAWRNNIWMPNTLQPKFEFQCNDLKGFVFGYSRGLNMDGYSMVTNEVPYYIKTNFFYREDIHNGNKGNHNYDIPDALEPIGIRVDRMSMTSQWLAYPQKSHI